MENFKKSYAPKETVFEFEDALYLERLQSGIYVTNDDYGNLVIFANIDHEDACCGLTKQDLLDGFSQAIDNWGWIKSDKENNNGKTKNR